MAISVIYFDLGDTLVRTTTKKWVAGGKALLADLKTDGFRLGIISNTGNLATRADILGLLPADFDLNAFESALVLFSSKVGVAKPDPAIFSKAISLTGGFAADCLYVSENIVETLVAQHVGMRSLRVQPPPGNDLSVLRGRIAEFQVAIS